jgi:hypothetical protein
MKNPNEPCQPSEAKINANRENAKKSTGPRTAEGKAASSRNRLLHGLRANKHILLDEDPEEFLFLLDDHLDRFQPLGASEENLVLRVAADQWRLDRVFSMEAGIFRDRFHDVAAKDERRQDRYTTKKDYAGEDGKPAPPPPTPPDERDLPARAFNVDCEGPNSFTKLARYETSIERSIDRCLRQLKTYQAARIASTPEVGQAVPPAEADTPPPDEPTKPGTSPQEAEVGQPAPPAEAATPPKSTNYHSNPKNGGIAKFGVLSGSAVMLLLMHALLHAVPELIAALAGLAKLTRPRTGHNRPKMNIYPAPRTQNPAPKAQNPAPARQPRPGGLHAIRAY